MELNDTELLHYGIDDCGDDFVTEAFILGNKMGLYSGNVHYYDFDNLDQFYSDFADWWKTLSNDNRRHIYTELKK